MRVYSHLNSLAIKTSGSSWISSPLISLRGIIISSTATFSRSRMPFSMPWWLSDILCPERSTTERNSSVSRPSSREEFGSKPSSFTSPLVSLLIAHTNGQKIVSRGLRIWLALKANHSGYWAAMVFGVTSAKTSTKMVRVAVATQGAAASPT